MATNRVTSVAIEVLRDGPSIIRATSVAVEVLRSVAFNTQINTGGDIGTITLSAVDATVALRFRAGGTVGTITLIAPDATTSIPIAVSGAIGTITLTPPDATVELLWRARGDIGTITFTAPNGAAVVVLRVGGDIGTITFTAPTFVGGRVTMFGASVLGLTQADPRVTLAGLEVLALTEVDARVTLMGLLVLAKGGEPPLLPDPLSLQDHGRKPTLTQRFVNMYVEPTPQGPASAARFSRPGLYEVTARGGGPVRATFLWRGFRITVSGESVWRDAVNIGTVPPNGPVRFAISPDECVLVVSDAAYFVTTGEVSKINDPDLGKVNDVVYLSGRFVYTASDFSGQYWWSAVNDAREIDGLGFSNAESNPDRLVGAAVLGDNIAFFGTVSTEWHYPTTDPDAPFQASQGRRYDKGLAAIRSLVLCDNSLMFVGNDRMVYRTSSVPLRISNFDVEDKLRRIADVDLPDITAFQIVYGGHTFYVMNLPGYGTWALDVGQKLWAEWKTWSKDRFRVNCAEEGFMGDFYTGKIMGFDGQLYSDLGDSIERVVSTFMSVKSGYEKNSNLTLECIRGVGTASGVYTEPVVEMRFSDQMGKKWSQWFEAPLGALGDGSKAAQATWTGLGAMESPGRLFEFRCTDHVDFAPYQAKINEQRA